jgi:pimeloyl-ACP methyl ester carboxylesterase
LLAHDTTADVARDMDLLRQAVGDPTMNYLGTSYGTYLGATYANLFPGKVRAMALDANVKPGGRGHRNGWLRASSGHLAATGYRRGVRGRPERVPRPVRSGRNECLRVLRGESGRHPRQVEHPAGPAG